MRGRFCFLYEGASTVGGAVEIDDDIFQGLLARGDHPYNFAISALLEELELSLGSVA